ncbi:cilia- and flagella-associated protein 95-like isoform X2 [Stegostoma tigrinum]|uniref:cilia- and flagella-associated protein 95-like isoform X2 n=1 Tax=Stegostoma tigrinum TaxID=3053191 RepID=UPI00202B9D62|nr:cilia- and flagella-associated protein 95-like isoform X2 [Stegostoma tigrinum]
MWANWHLRRNFEVDYPDRKGSLTLRSNHKEYSRPVLVCNWYQHREAEPKDYDMDAIPEGHWKNLHRSTYKRLTSFPSGDWSTTSEAFMSQISFKEDYRLREKMPLMDQKTAAKELRKRTAGGLDTKANAALPRHPPDYSKLSLLSLSLSGLQRQLIIMIICLRSILFQLKRRLLRNLVTIEDAIHNLLTQMIIVGMAGTPGLMRVEYMPILN